MGTQHNTWHIPHIAQKGGSDHDMSCPSKGITLCQSLIGTQGEFLCNTNTCALHSKVILTHAMSWPKSYNANSTLLTMIPYTSAHATPPSGERTPREREGTHTKRTRGDHQKGNRTERSERTDHMEWRTSERG